MVAMVTPYLTNGKKNIANNAFSFYTESIPNSLKDNYCDEI